MPNILLKVPKGCFTADQLDQIAKHVTDAAHAAEGVPDDPKHHIISWLFIEEAETQHLYIGGNPVFPSVKPIIAMLFQPEGVLDADRRALQAARIDKNIREVLGADADQVQISCIMMDIPDGQWGGNGAIWRLPEIASVAGFQHLTHLAKSA